MSDAKQFSIGGQTLAIRDAMLKEALQNGAGMHNAIYRGKNLGSSVSAAQYAAIGGGSFDDLYIGDYWQINSITWRIAAFDYWLRCGDTECTTHHVVIVPDQNLLSANGSTTKYMNSSDTTEGGYVGSGFYSRTNKDNSSNTAKATCKNTVKSAFGEAHILVHREYFSNAVTNGRPSAGAWYDSDVDMMNENMVYGGDIFAPHSDGTNVPAKYTIDKGQLPLFALDPSKITNRAHWWLRDVVSGSHFANCNNNGNANYNGASNTWVGVRPAISDIPKISPLYRQGMIAKGKAVHVERLNNNAEMRSPAVWICFMCQVTMRQ
jgi:hypothetical protein